MMTLKQISMMALGRPLRRLRRATPRGRSGEAGYTLLFAVFLAASMLIMLSVVALKVTTQGQREKEEEMIWRGHQYERGIQRYVQKFGRYPSKIDDMVKATSGVRYMREAYKDPMNKEDGSWRFIYVTPAGQLIGSVRYTSLVQMALMDKMASMGGSMNAVGAIPGTSPLNGGGSSPFGNSSGFGSPAGSAVRTADLAAARMDLGIRVRRGLGSRAIKAQTRTTASRIRIRIRISPAIRIIRATITTATGIRAEIPRAIRTVIRLADRILPADRMDWAGEVRRRLASAARTGSNRAAPSAFRAIRMAAAARWGR